MPRNLKADTEPKKNRRIRSFVRRAGRLTAGQQRALKTLWPVWGLAYTAAPIDPERIFGRQAPLILEIGFGNGELLTTMAADHPERNFLGIEVHEPGVRHCLLCIDRLGLTNVRLLRHDAIEVLENQIPDAALHGIHLFFPDPWPKKRQHKRRIVQPDFVTLLGHKIETGGYFHPATDWKSYAQHIDETVTKNRAFKAMEAKTSKRPETKFERRGKRLGHEIWEQIYTRI